MKYRVTIKNGSYELLFDFETAIDAMTFMDSATTKYVGEVDDPTRDNPRSFKVLLQMIKETPANE